LLWGYHFCNKKNCLFRRVTFLKRDNLVVFYYLKASESGLVMGQDLLEKWRGMTLSFVLIYKYHFPCVTFRAYHLKRKKSLHMKLFWTLIAFFFYHLNCRKDNLLMNII
jgi:uncharacterized RDD family membrane protein YckC